MKTIAQLTRFFLLTGLIIFSAVISCKKKDDPKPSTIDPTNAEAITNAISFGSTAQRKQGNLPTGTSGIGAPTLITTSVLTVANSTIGIPVQFNANNVALTITQINIQVVGSSSYFVIPVTTPTTSGIIQVPLTLPAGVLKGNFTLSITITTSNGTSSTVTSTPIKIDETLTCSNGSQSGSDGVTFRRFAISKSGTVRINYDTYSVPDRIDIFVGGRWVAGTGSATSIPVPVSNCSTPAPGFVGTSGVFSFNADVADKYVDVYVSGCLGGGTAWDYTFTCPN